MSSISIWYDPVCYQFFFYAYSNEKTECSIMNTFREFLEELTPFYSLWLSMNGRIMSQQWTESGCKVVSISDTGALVDYGDSIASYTGKSIKLSLIPGKALANYTVPSRCVEKQWKEQIMRYTNLREIDTIDKAAQKEWLHNLLNCPTDDLRGLYFPKGCFMPNDIPLKLYYERFCSLDTPAYMNEIVKDIDISPSHSDSIQPQYLHRMYVSIPRYMLDVMNQTFNLQFVWKERMTRLCCIGENSIGYMKMDACEIRRGSPLLSGSGAFIPSFSQYLPDVAWAMCLTKKQVAALGGMEYLKGSQVFHHMEALKNGKVYLQLTPDISIVTKNEACKLWNTVSPHLQATPYFTHSIGEVPVSFRIGIDRSKLRIDGFGRYQVTT